MQSMRRMFAVGRSWLLALYAKRHKRLTPLRVAGSPAKPQRATFLPEEFRRTISREEIASLPIRRYEGEIVVVNTPAALTAAMRDIRQTRVVGFDTETRPAFTKGVTALKTVVQ